MIKYIRNSAKIDECLETDQYGNRIHKSTGEYAIVIEGDGKPTYKPMSLTMVGGEWVPVQMELDFG